MEKEDINRVFNYLLDRMIELQDKVEALEKVIEDIQNKINEE